MFWNIVLIILSLTILILVYFRIRHRANYYSQGLSYIKSTLSILYPNVETFHEQMEKTLTNPYAFTMLFAGVKDIVTQARKTSRSMIVTPETLHILYASYSEVCDDQKFKDIVKKFKGEKSVIPLQTAYQDYNVLAGAWKNKTPLSSNSIVRIQHALSVYEEKQHDVHMSVS